MAKIHTEENFDVLLKEALNHAMLKAAEPIIQQALRDAEREMREKLAQRLIGLIEQNISIQRMGRDLVIHLKQEG